MTRGMINSQMTPNLFETCWSNWMPHKSIRPRGSHPRVLKVLGDVIDGPLSAIFQYSSEFADVPVKWRLANVVTVFKKDVPGVEKQPRRVNAAFKVTMA
ncbi:hypothetical protein BTVI_14820 [Pitangus sulphuratus]|nr:hypothetical protein BTVI_14820 [Pitangus sulphuratus]